MKGKEIRKLILELREAGVPYVAIARSLNQKGIKTVFGKRWSLDSVVNVVRSEDYNDRLCDPHSLSAPIAVRLPKEVALALGESNRSGVLREIVTKAVKDHPDWVEALKQKFSKDAI